MEYERDKEEARKKKLMSHAQKKRNRVNEVKVKQKRGITGVGKLCRVLT